MAKKKTKASESQFTERITVRFTSKERKDILKLAKAHGVSPSDYIRCRTMGTRIKQLGHKPRT